MYGVIVPAEADKPILRFEFDGDRDLMPALHEILGDNIDLSGQIHSARGRLQMAVRGDSLTRPGADIPNERAIAVCRSSGYNVPDVIGRAAFWGGADEAGNAQGLSGAWLATFASLPAFAVE